LTVNAVTSAAWATFSITSGWAVWAATAIGPILLLFVHINLDVRQQFWRILNLVYQHGSLKP
jgi:hypothetical protein